MGTSTALLAYINDSQFWSSFFAELAAGMVLLAFASWLIPKFIRWKEMPNVRFLDFKRRKEAFIFTPTSNGEWQTTLHLIIQNRGSRTLEKYYWEIFVENGVSIDLQQIPNHPASANFALERGEEFSRLYGYMALPIFPLDDVDFPFEIKLNITSQKSLTLYYFFRTEYGQYPFWSWLALHLKKYRFLKRIVVKQGMNPVNML